MSLVAVAERYEEAYKMIFSMYINKQIQPCLQLLACGRTLMVACSRFFETKKLNLPNKYEFLNKFQWIVSKQCFTRTLTAYK